MVQAASSQKNLWVAASDGDIERVRALIESGMSPNDKDSNSYTPMHAAASYAHLELLTYLLSSGGDINIPDADNETPLYTVETLAAARFCVENGADVNWQNSEGLTPAQFLEEDHPEISSYLDSLSSTSNPALNPNQLDPSSLDGPSALALDGYADTQASALMRETQAIMEEAERTGEDPEERLREVVERAVREGIAWGGGAAEGGAGGAPAQGNGTNSDGDIKRRRED